MPRLFLLFFPVVFLLGFLVATIAEQRKGIARLLAVVTIVFLFLAIVLALMTEIREWIWLNNFILIIVWIASFATAIKYFRGNSQRGKAFLISCLLIVAVTTLTFANAHVQDLVKEWFCSYVECSDREAELVDADFLFVNAKKDSVSTLVKGEKYNLIIVDSFYRAPSDLIKLLPGFGPLKDDSVRVLELSVWRQEKKVKTLNKCITEADDSLAEYEGFPSLNDPRYASLEELKGWLNTATHDEFHADELGGNGLKYQFMISTKSSLSGEYDMRLEFVFKSGKRIYKEKKISLL